MRKRKAPPHCFWRGPVLWGRQTILNRKQQWSLHTDDYDTAKARCEAERARRLAAARYGDARTTFEDAMTGWLNDYVPERGISANTAKRYLVSLGQMAGHLEGRYVDEIDLPLIDKIAAARRASGVVPATLRRDLGALGSVLAYAKARRLRPDNPALDRLKEVKERRDPIVLPDPAHVEMVIRRAPGLMAGLIRAAWLTGCRLEELVTAERPRIDHDRRELTVIGKGNKLRVVGLDYGSAYDLIRSLPAYAGSPWLFWHGQGQPYRNLSSRHAAIVRATAGDAEREAKATGQASTFRPFRFHDLRHLHAVEWLRTGGDLYALQQRLGHKSITTTEIYLTFLPGDKAEEAKHGRTSKNRVSTNGALK